ncbi:uncharacterized protein LOC130277391 [Hyla sarda]|uniref:uncharacterized protein LOC130277391 n=1 Tax=Hyla sarda TaxID=327740 RepID=UPI0024C469BE|nr:uncharacterized protein LOC130277391 [Hyla sarda]
MIHVKDNRVAPLFPGTCQQTTGRDKFFGEGQVNKSSLPGNIEKHCQHQTTAVTCEERNGALQNKEYSHNGFNRDRTSHIFTCSPGDVHSPYVGLSGTCHHSIRHQEVDAFLKDSRAAVNNAIPFSCCGLPTAQSGIVAVHQGGGRWVPEYLSHEKKEDPRKSEKSSQAPRCPSCQKLTVRVFSVPYQDPAYKLSGDEKSRPASRHHTKVLLPIKPGETSATSSLAAWAEYLKCFVRTCPNTQETAFCQHYYALSVICWTAVILTLIIVIAATVHSV